MTPVLVLSGITAFLMLTYLFCFGLCWYRLTILQEHFQKFAGNFQCGLRKGELEGMTDLSHQLKTARDALSAIHDLARHKGEAGKVLPEIFDLSEKALSVIRKDRL